MKIYLTVLSMLLSLIGFGKSDSLSYYLSGGAMISSGNVKSNSYNVTAELKGFSFRDDWAINPTYRYVLSYPYPITSTSTPTKQNEFYMSSHFSKRLDSCWKIMLFSEIEHSQLRKIDMRYDIGIGPAYRLVKNKTLLIELSGVIMPDYYNTLPIKNAIIQRDNLAIRASLRLKCIIRFDRVTINSVQMIQPPLKTWTYDDNYVGWADNFNFRSHNTIDMDVWKGLSFGVSADYVYQSFLTYLSKEPEVVKSGVYLSPADMAIAFYIKYKG